MLRQGHGILLLDVTPITLGINIAGNRLYPLILKNSKIPTRREHYFTTHRDAQTRARMVILQGDNTIASENARLGEVVLERLRGAERFRARILVVFEVDANGILHVKAVDEDTGEEREIVVRDSFNPQEDTAGQIAEADSLTPSNDYVRPTFAGPFRATELVDVLFFLHANGKTGRVVLNGPECSGSIWLLEGDITHAQSKEEAGEAALKRLLAMSEGHYAYHERDTLEGPRQITGNFDSLMELAHG